MICHYVSVVLSVWQLKNSDLCQISFVFLIFSFWIFFSKMLCCEASIIKSGLITHNQSLNWWRISYWAVAPYQRVEFFLPKKLFWSNINFQLQNMTGGVIIRLKWAINDLIPHNFPSSWPKLKNLDTWPSKPQTRGIEGSFYSNGSIQSAKKSHSLAILLLPKISQIWQK